MTSINDLVVEMSNIAERFGFSQEERHVVGEVTRFAYDYAKKRNYVDPIHHAKKVASQYMAGEIDGWHRKPWKNQADGAQ